MSFRSTITGNPPGRSAWVIPFCSSMSMPPRTTSTPTLHTMEGCSTTVFFAWWSLVHNLQTAYIGSANLIGAGIGMKSARKKYFGDPIIKGSEL